MVGALEVDVLARRGEGREQISLGGRQRVVERRGPEDHPDVLGRVRQRIEARELIEAAFAADERVLKDPAPAVSVAELADSSVNLNVRPWVKSADYWNVRSDLLENIKIAFDQNGISIPYPQQDVHMHNAA